MVAGTGLVVHGRYLVDGVVDKTHCSETNTSQEETRNDPVGVMGGSTLLLVVDP